MSRILLRSALLIPLLSLAAAPVPDAYNVAFSTYFGGSDFEQIRDITTDAAGNVYITGGTGSPNFPTTPGAYQRTSRGWFDVFVVKFSPSGQLIWSTLLGGPGYDRAYGIEVDNAGYVYLSGRSGPGFPTTAGVLQPTYQGYDTGAAYGNENAFIAKLKPDGSGLVWATYFGTGAMNRDFDINKTTGEIWVASTYEPATGQAPFNSAWFANGFRKTPVGGDDNVVAKITSDGTQVLWATYIGGSATESGKNSLRVDGAGNVHLFTNTQSTNMPLANAYQSTLKGQADFYLAKIRADGAALIFATYFGGSGNDWCETHHLALDPTGNVFISGITESTDLPTTAGAFQRTFGGINGKTNFHATGDGYVAKFSPTGQLLASTYLGGRYGDGAQGLACDGQGNVYFCGGTVSDNLPVTAGAFQSAFRGVEDFMAVKMSADLSQVLYCSYIGSSGYDEGRVCWAEANGTFYMAGETAGTNWPVVNAAQATYGGGTGDCCFAKFVPTTPLPVVSVAATDASASEPGTDKGTFTVTRTGSTAASLTVTFSVGGTATPGTDYAALGSSVTIPAGAASATLTVTAIDNAIAESNETVVLTISSNAAYTVGTPAGATVTIGDNDGGTGLKGEYYGGTTFNTLLLTRSDASVNFNWGTGSPDPALPADGFSVRWTGRVTASFSETYTFTTNTDDGVRLWVNGELLVDKWADQSATEWSGTIALEAGKSYTLEMDYYDHSGSAVAQLLWSSPSTPKAVIPTARLLPTTGLPPGGDLDSDGVPDLQDPDRDGDGWSNVVETSSGTDPDDPTWHPAASGGGSGAGGGGGRCGATGLEVLLLTSLLRRRRIPRVPAGIRVSCGCS